MVNSKKIKFIDLFAGIGGIRIGFEEGMKHCGIQTECVFTSEIKKYAIAPYKEYFGEEKIFGDITKIPTQDIPDFDFLLAGFPCQPFSSAGNRLGFLDTRGTLFFEIERILREKQPFCFILENVEGLTTHANGQTFQVMKNILESLGYKLSYKVLNACNFGVPQNRKRIYIVGLKNTVIDLNTFKTTTKTFGAIQEHNQPTSQTAFTKKLLEHFKIQALAGKSIKDKRGGDNNIHSWEFAWKGELSQIQIKLLNTLLKERRKKKWAEETGIVWMDGMPLTETQISCFFKNDNLHELLEDLVRKGYLAFEHPKKLLNNKRISDPTKPKGYNIVAGKLSFEFTKILDPDAITPTLVATDIEKLGVIDNGGIRKLTLREGLRLYGFPDNYSLGMIKYREAIDLIGNTVCVPVIQAISEKIAKKIIKQSKPTES